MKSLKNNFSLWFKRVLDATLSLTTITLHRTPDKRFLQKRVLQKLIVPGRTSALQEEPFWTPYFLECGICTLRCNKACDGRGITVSWGC